MSEVPLWCVKELQAPVAPKTPQVIVVLGHAGLSIIKFSPDEPPCVRNLFPPSNLFQNR